MNTQTVVTTEMAGTEQRPAFDFLNLKTQFDTIREEVIAAVT